MHAGTSARSRGALARRMRGADEVAGADLAQLGHAGRRSRRRGSRTDSAARSGTPSGGSTRSGGRPGIAVSRPWRMPSPSSCGSAPSSASVYGCSGWSKRSSTGACSTIWPAYMTTMSSAASATTPMSWVMMIIDIRARRGAPRAGRGPGLHGDVERRRRLVGDQQLRVAGERDRDHHALPHAAREPVRIVVEPLRGAFGMPHLLEQLDRALARRRPSTRSSVPADRLGDLRPDLQRRVQRGHRVLEDHRDLLAAHVLELPLGELRQVAALEQDLARRRSWPAASGSGP